MKKEIISKINQLAGKRIPFIILVDFNKKMPVLVKLSDLDNKGLLFSTHQLPVDTQTNNIKNISLTITDENILRFLSAPIIDNIPADYLNSFNKVRENLLYGNSYLTNLAYQTNINININLDQLFYLCDSKYKIYFNNSILSYNLVSVEQSYIDNCWKQFVCFSPETFIKIENNKIVTNPMKGTILANLNNAKDLLRNNLKESQEHNTIVDLLRNDISVHSTNVLVSRLKYIERIKNNREDLLAMSSQIEGDLDVNWYHNLGDIINSMLPAGSVSGAPKESTVNIINHSEKFDRKYYCGIFGIFDGNKFDSAILIRLIAQHNSNQYYFYSGGGITHQSNVVDEFREVINKIYLPLK